ncbi:hypothetical protein O181_093504 [Austropuccinia psidii MF-1]|uniref:Uncharacterized protein n=1 Tax=Austropuccinia psidii MF-1 TaxID=1389203 RepID=A0A9Q3P9W2_9BASI|nr:hypothetical protein [Austropuccinia psidii MF-1]
MPLQHSPPARQKIPQDRAEAVQTPTPRAPLDGTPEAPPLKAHLDRGPIKGPSEDGEEEEENSVEEEESDGTEAAPALVGASEGTVTKALMEAPVAWHSGLKNSLGGLQKI